MPARVMLIVRDVEASSRWYQELLGAESGHGGPEFEMIVRDGEVLLMLHHAEVEEHPAIRPPSPDTAGSGVLLYFSEADVDAVYGRATAMQADVLDEPHVNPLAHHYEFSLRDPGRLRDYGVSEGVGAPV